MDRIGVFVAQKLRRNSANVTQTHMCDLMECHYSVIITIQLVVVVYLVFT